MSQQVQELINKIKIDGIKEAENKAKEIEAQSQQKAAEIVNKAKQQASKLVADAELKSKKISESTHMALQQSSRDMLLNLRKEIEHTLTALISSSIKQALTPESLAVIIQEIAKGYLKQNTEISDITVVLSAEDLEKLKNGFTAKLQDQLKKPLVFKSADDVQTGFTISFDSGKSCFDFTDASLVEFLGGYLNTEVSSLLSKTISKK